MLGGKAGGIGIDGRFHAASLRLMGIGKDYTVLTQEEVNGLDTPFLRASFALYNRWKLLGALPHGQGTLGERNTVLEILEALEGESNRFEGWYLDHKEGLIEHTTEA